MQHSIIGGPTHKPARIKKDTSSPLQGLRNTIFNEDCLEGMKRIPDKSVTMVLTDIPYGECNSFAPGIRQLNKGAADTVTFDIEPFIREIDRIVTGSVYTFCGFEQVSEIRKLLKSLGYTTRLCIWNKSNPMPLNGKNVWLSNVEACIYGKKRHATFNEHCKGTVWNFPVGRSKRHPTEKPLKLMEYLISVSSDAGDVILDPCMGSGTTAEAAKMLGRDYIGFEINDDFYNVAMQRVGNRPSQDSANACACS
ncbi:MAG TPA: site-specific DNA-methyltransferase [Thiobacillaceae bacterium]|nr:site-specific DNA-methyltransferase [Thiobacillaceae bacterium]